MARPARRSLVRLMPQRRRALAASPPRRLWRQPACRRRVGHPAPADRGGTDLRSPGLPLCPEDRDDANPEAGASHQGGRADRGDHGGCRSCPRRRLASSRAVPGDGPEAGSIQLRHLARRGIVRPHGVFAGGLCDDQPAVRAALSLPWSNGQTEGQITKLKLVERQMYGRAKLDLLRARLLGVA